MQVNIYVESDFRSMKKAERTVIYLLECRIRDMPITKYGLFTITGSFNECILTGMIKALERVKKPSEITFYSSNSFVLDMIEYHLPGWAEHNFMRKDGKEISNRNQWMDFYEKAHKHYYSTNHGHHEYRSWMLSEICRKRKENEEDKEGRTD